MESRFPDGIATLTDGHDKCLIAEGDPQAAARAFLRPMPLRRARIASELRMVFARMETTRRPPHSCPLTTA